MPVRFPKPKRRIHASSRSVPSFSASVIAPTFDDRARICWTVIRSVERCSASWITRSATRIEYGSVKAVRGVTRPSESTLATVISLNVDPGSYVSVTALFRWNAAGTSGNLFAS